MLLIGCNPPGRAIEQHDIFMGIAENIKELVPGIIEYWPEAKGKIHVDAWREVTHVDGHKIAISTRSQTNVEGAAEIKLFFMNLGGYKQGDFEEYHYRMLVAAPDKNAAMKMAKHSAFFKHTGFKGATAHIDEKYGVDIDDIYTITDLLSHHTKKHYSLRITPEANGKEDEVHLGYFRLEKL